MTRCLLLTAAAAPAGGWPTRRGSTSNGIAPKDAHTNIKWEAKLPGCGSATPIVVGD